MKFYPQKTAIVCLLILTSCISMSEQEQTQNLLSLPSVDTSVADSIRSGFFSVGGWPSKQWWDVFHSQELDHYIQTALLYNPSIKAIERRVEFAKQTAKVVKSKLFPLVFFDADETWEYLSKNGLYRAFNPTLPLNANLVDLTLSFHYEFDFWGKNRNLFHAALGEQKSQLAEAFQVELITTTAVAQAYFAIKTNLEKKRLYTLLLEARKDIYDLQLLLEDKALLSRLTPLIGNENVKEAEKRLIAIDEEIQTEVHLLNILMGKGPDEPLAISEDPFLLPSTISIPNTLSIDLLARRPDLMAQIWKVESLAHEVGAAKADFFPDINLVGFLGLESIAYSKLLNSSSKTVGLQPAIHLPIFTAGAIRANVRAKKAEFDKAVYDYNNMILQSTKEVTDFLVFAQSVFAQKQEQQAIVDDAREWQNLVYLRSQKGLDNAIAVYLADIQLIEKELENVNLLYSQYLAVIKLIKSLGGGYVSDYLPLQAQGAPGHD